MEDIGRVDLQNHWVADGLGNLHRLSLRLGNVFFRDRNTVQVEQLFALMFGETAIGAGQQGKRRFASRTARRGSVLGAPLSQTPLAKLAVVHQRPHRPHCSDRRSVELNASFD